MPRALWLGVAVSCLVGCSNTTPLSAGTDGAAGTSAAGTSGAAGTSAAGTTGAAGTGSVVVQPEPSRDCGSAPLDTQAFSSISSVYEALVGRWMFCGGAVAWDAPQRPADAIGIEFEPPTYPGLEVGKDRGGPAHYLVAGMSGAQRGVGPSYELHYEAPNATQVDIKKTDDAWFFVNNRRTSSGAEISLRVMYKENWTRLIRF